MKIIQLVTLFLLLGFKSYGSSVEVTEKWLKDQSSDLKNELIVFNELVNNKCIAAEIIDIGKKVQLSKQLKVSFDRLMAKWQRQAVISLKPTQLNKYKSSIQFYPDTKGRIKKKLIEYLREQDSIDVDFLKGTVFYSAGLSALEMLLYDESESFQTIALENTKVFCGLVINIPLHLVDKQLEYEKELDKYLGQISQVEIEEDLLNTLIFSLEEIKKLKLSRPINVETSLVKVKRFESYRSQNTKNNLINNFLAQKALLDLVYQPWLLELETQTANSTYDLVNLGYERVLDDLGSLERPLSDLTAEHSDYENMVRLSNNTTALIQVLKRQMAPQLDISLQFNGADGD
ncbi:MAG: hypothetical protein HRT44_04425 [Bdellovibrionales bacterium]|nr:hypothetical protein [Bdellovibrionales bacterium]NQZ18489.1 hypothetical protein [Bdellovibrionales bacterium]